MVLLTSALYIVLMFILPGQLGLLWLAGRTEVVPQPVALTILNFIVFGVLALLVRFTRAAIFDIGWEKGHATQRLAEWLDVSGWRWLNLVGIIGIGAGAAVLAQAGLLPYPFWFLFGAIIIGLLDMGQPVVPLPLLRPEPRFPAELIVPETPQPGKAVTYQWLVYRSQSTAGSQARSAQFMLDDDEYQRARGQERFPTRPVAEYVKYVKLGMSPSVQRVAAHFRAHSSEHAYSALDELMDVVGFTRAIEYHRDQETRGVPDYANFPIETLYDAAGDCEDHAILAAALLHQLGHDVALFHVDLGDSGHLALGYRPVGSTFLPAGPFSGDADNGRQYYYVETVPTDVDSGLGHICQEFLERIEGRSVLALT